MINGITLVDVADFVLLHLREMGTFASAVVGPGVSLPYDLPLLVGDLPIEREPESSGMIPPPELNASMERLGIHIPCDTFPNVACSWSSFACGVSRVKVIADSRVKPTIQCNGVWLLGGKKIKGNALIHIASMGCSLARRIGGVEMILHGGVVLVPTVHWDRWRIVQGIGIDKAIKILALITTPGCELTLEFKSVKMIACGAVAAVSSHVE